MSLTSISKCVTEKVEPNKTSSDGKYLTEILQLKDKKWAAVNEVASRTWISRERFGVLLVTNNLTPKSVLKNGFIRNQ